MNSGGLSYVASQIDTLPFFRLALRAEVGAAVTDGDALNGVATDGAGLAAKAVGDLELKVGGARCAIGAEVGINAGTFIANS